MWGGSFCVAFCYFSFFSSGKARSKMFLRSMIFESLLIVVLGTYLLSEAMLSRRLKAFEKAPIPKPLHSLLIASHDPLFFDLAYIITNVRYLFMC